jgi:hypothetical protein
MATLIQWRFWRALDGRPQRPIQSSSFEIGGGLARMNTKPRTAHAVYIVCLTIWFQWLATVAAVASLRIKT